MSRTVYRLPHGRLPGLLDQTRISEGLNWRQVADQMGVHPVTLSRLVNGHTPSTTTLIASLGWLGLLPDLIEEMEPTR